MVGGVTGGYWDRGRVRTASAPARVKSAESTVAKIGRSMKKRGSTRALLLSGYRRLDRGRLLGHHLDPGSDPLEPADDHPVVRLDPLLDHPQPPRLGAER